MCGIVGFTHRGAEDAAGLVRRMAVPLQPRGPDGEGYFADGRAALGHRRLSVLDLVTGAQPMKDAGGRYHIVCNGEIYNFLELRAELAARGVAFRTRSDTEVVLELFAREGAAALQRLNGMFALAIWDEVARRLFLARDRMGVKPLFYAARGAELVFASELKALLLHPAVGRRLRRSAVPKYFAFGYVPAPETIFEGVCKLEPGGWLEWHERGFRTGRYWDLPAAAAAPAAAADECAGELLELLRDAVSLRLRADVPVGIFLSGGIDSSLVTALAAGSAARPPPTFSIGFAEGGFDESPYAREVAARWGTAHHHAVLTPAAARDLLPAALRVLDEPLADASIVPTFLLARLAAGTVKVALGGDGGDELFAGYPAFPLHRLMERAAWLPPAFFRGLERLADRLPVTYRYTSAHFLLRQFLDGYDAPPEARFLLWLGCAGARRRDSLFAPGLRRELAAADPYEDVARHALASGRPDVFERLLYLAAKMYLQDDILVKVDRAAMAHSLEVRAPFLDYRLVEWAARLPARMKTRRGVAKWLLKRAARGLLPDRIIRRRKAGFMVPLAAWLAGAWRPLVEEQCDAARLRDEGLFDPAGVRRLLDEHFERRRDHRKLIWALLVFQAWRQNYLCA